jgi:hypothetical protein
MARSAAFWLLCIWVHLVLYDISPDAVQRYPYWILLILEADVASDLSHVWVPALPFTVSRGYRPKFPVLMH